MIDLHTHTVYSDGTDSFKKLLRNAEKLNLEVLSITDHNTCAAYYELSKIDVDKFYSGKIIIGCEFTTSFKGRIIEVLGYGFDIKLVNSFLAGYYSPDKVESFANKIYISVLDRLDELNLQYSKEKFRKKKFKTEFVERTIFEELIKHDENFKIIGGGVLSSFSNFWRKGLTNPESKLYIDYASAKPKLEDICNVVHEAKGKLFLAHPYGYKFDDTENFIEDIYDSIDFDGIECFYTSFSKDQSQYLVNFAKKRNLLICGGSDYHGKNKKNFHLGMGIRDLNINKNILDNWNIEYYK